MSWKPIADVICWQECTDPGVRDELAAELPEYDHETFADRVFGPGMNTISWRRGKFRLVDSGFVEASESRENVSPTRYVCWVILEHIASGVSMAVINCHFVVAWNVRPGDPNKAWRHEQWANNLRVLRTVVKTMRIQGLPVLVGGDLNRAEWDVISPDLVEPRYWDEPNPLVDRIAVSRDVKVLDSRTGPQNGSDHFSIHARVLV